MRTKIQLGNEKSIQDDLNYFKLLPYKILHIHTYIKILFI